MSKRYFQKIYDEQYYIFDSQQVSEEEIDERIEYEDYCAFEDSMSNVVDVLNEQEDEIKRLKKELFEVRKEYIIDTADISDKLHLDELIEEERKAIYGDDLNE